MLNQLKKFLKMLVAIEFILVLIIISLAFIMVFLPDLMSSKAVLPNNLRPNLYPNSSPSERTTSIPLTVWQYIKDYPLQHSQTAHDDEDGYY